MFTNKTSVKKTGKFGEERFETKPFDACHTRFAVFFTPPSSWVSSLLSALRSSLIHMTSNQVILGEWKQTTSHRNNDDQLTTEETIVRIHKPWVWFNNENFLITATAMLHLDTLNKSKRLYHMQIRNLSLSWWFDATLNLSELVALMFKYATAMRDIHEI